MSIPSALHRLFKPGLEAPLASFQVVVHLSPDEPLPDEALEETAARAHELLVERGRGAVLGPVVGCDFTQNAVEIEFTVEAASPEELHGKIGSALRILVEAGPFRYRDSRTERLEELVPV